MKPRGASLLIEEWVNVAMLIFVKVTRIPLVQKLLHFILTWQKRRCNVVKKILKNAVRENGNVNGILVLCLRAFLQQDVDVGLQGLMFVALTNTLSTTE